MSVNKGYFTDLFRDRKLSQREVARRIGVWPGGLSLTMDGKRALKMDEAVKLARVLSVPLAEVLANAGIREAQGTIRYCDIIGHVGDLYVTTPVPPDSVERLPIPEGLPDEVVAVQYHTSDTPSAFSDGWVTFLGEEMDPTQLLGMFSLVAIEGTGWVLGTIRRGYTPGTYNIFPPGREAQKNVRLLWARRALITAH